MLRAQGQIFELKDGAGTIAPIVLKAAKKAALISDLEREWGVGQKVATSLAFVTTNVHHDAVGVFDIVNYCP